MSEAWYRRTACEIAEAVRNKHVTAREVAQNHLDRIAETDDKLNAFVEVWHEDALRMAGEVDALIKGGEDPGPLAGVPIGLKDNLCTTIGHTTCSSKILQGFRSPYDATVVTRMRDNGGVFLGKLNMDEFAMGSSTENSALKKTRNPWDLRRVPGGSSGGVSASVAAGQVALAIGSDTGGSIRQPAAFTGCVGFKPTYGRVSRFGVVAFASSLDQIGPITRDVADTALVMSVLSGRDPSDATSADVPVPDYRGSLTADFKGVRIGLPGEYYTDALSDDMRQKTMAAVEVMRSLGAEVVDISLPHSQYGVAVYYVVATAEASANLARFDGVRYGFRHPDADSVDNLYKLSKSHGFGEEVQRRIMLGTYVLSSGYYDAYYLKAQQVRALIRRDFDRAFEQCDFIVTPTTPTPAFVLGEKIDDPLQMYLNDVYTISVNLSGVPAISVPSGLTADGLPTGLQIIGKPFAEDALFQLAHTYEHSRGFKMGHAPVA